MRILVTGSREWTDWEVLHEVLEAWTRGADSVTIVHGGAPGADRLAGDYARAAGWAEEVHPADWAQYGKPAGMIRNKAMVDVGADVCIAFFKASAGNRGTRGCAKMAEEAGIPVRRIEG